MAVDAGYILGMRSAVRPTPCFPSCSRAGEQYPAKRNFGIPEFCDHFRIGPVWMRFQRTWTAAALLRPDTEPVSSCNVKPATQSVMLSGVANFIRWRAGEPTSAFSGKPRFTEELTTESSQFEMWSRRQRIASAGQRSAETGYSRDLHEFARLYGATTIAETLMSIRADRGSRKYGSLSRFGRIKLNRTLRVRVSRPPFRLTMIPPPVVPGIDAIPMEVFGVAGMGVRDFLDESPHYGLTHAGRRAVHCAGLEHQIACSSNFPSRFRKGPLQTSGSAKNCRRNVQMIYSIPYGEHSQPSKPTGHSRTAANLLISQRTKDELACSGRVSRLRNRQQGSACAAIGPLMILSGGLSAVLHQPGRDRACDRLRAFGRRRSCCCSPGSPSEQVTLSRCGRRTSTDGAPLSGFSANRSDRNTCCCHRTVAMPSWSKRWSGRPRRTA